jgi:large subunit ribosomal protein L13
MSTPVPKGAVARKWILVDVDGKVLGRAATRVASLLKGKHKPIYVTYQDTGDHVVVINAAKLRLTGKKLDQKMHFRHSGWPGGDHFISYRVLMDKKPEKAFWLAVKGMLPKNTLGREMIKKLKIYRGATHEHAAQKPIKMEI